MIQPAQSTLEQLSGCRVTGVTFGRGYVRLGFDFLTLTCHAWPRVCVQGATRGFDMPGYRDALCEQIEKVVSGITVEQGIVFRMRFTDGSVIAVSLRPEDVRGPQALDLKNLRGEPAA
jgi:hypothetical protein